MDEAKEKGDSVSIVSESSVTVSETVVETMACEDRIRIKEGGEAGLGNGDDVTVEVLDSHVHIDRGDGGAVQARSIDEAVCGHQESSKVGLEVNMRTLDSECHAVGGLGSRMRAQNEVNGGVVRSCSNDVVCGHDESDEVGLEGNPSTLDSEGDLAGDLGSRYEVSGGEAKAWNEVNGARVLGFSALGSSAGKNAEQSSGINEGGGDLIQAKETGKVGNLDSYELNHGNQERVVCLSAASEDSGVQTKIVEEAAMAIDEEDLNALDGGQETPISEPIKKAASVGVDATSLNVNTLVTAECVPDSEAKGVSTENLDIIYADPVYSCQSTGSIAAGQLDEKVSSNMEIDKQGTDSEQQQMEVKTPHLSTQKHDTGNVQSLKPEPIIDGEEGVGLSTGEAVLAEKQVSDAKEVGFDAEQDVKVEKMGVSPKNRDASDASEPLGHQMDVFVGSGEVEAAKVDNNVLNQISPAVASDKEIQSSGNEDPLAKNVVSEDDSSVEQEMNVEDQATSDEPDCLEQVEEMEVVEHDSNSDQPTNVDEQTVKQTALKSLSGVKMHQAQQLLSEEEGGFSVSDLVWGKVKSHPWWPGQIFDPSDASKKAVKYQKKDSFLNAVNCALEEVSRRVELGLACPCIRKDAYDRIKFQKVENTGVREESSLRDGVDVSLSVSSFEPDKLIDYMKALAESPYSGGDRIDLVIAKAQLLAFYRLKGYHQLPESQFSEEKRLEVVDCATPMDMDGEQKSEASKTRRRSYLKRKHNLKDGLYPSKKERSLSELMSETFDSPDGEIGSDVISNKPPSSSFGKKRKAIDSSEDSVMQEGRKTSKGSLSTPHFPKPSFKIGERISRAASQMTGSPSILKSSGDRLQKLDGGCETPDTCGYDVPIDNLEDAERKRMGILTEYSSLDELLLQLHLAACDPMKGYSSLNIIISFFSDFRDSIVLDRLSRDKAVGQRKKSPNSIIGFSETFEFEDMSDTYWTDRIVQNGSEEQPSLGTNRGQYQFVPVELDKPIQKVRKSRKRYSDTSHDLTAQKPPGYVDERAPAEIVMSFPEINSVPSETKLNKMFKHFGPLKEPETEVDCETSRARVVFRRSSDAEVAYNSARKFNIFGPVSVTYQLNYTISESFKASLYAPTLAEENPFIASAPCGDHALIAPSLGEEASFMVSTLGEETLPITTTFHEEPWFIASTTGEDTLAIPTTLADGASDVATTMYEKTLPVTTTAGVETMADATTIVDKTFTVATTVGEQSLPVFTTIDEQPSTAAASLVDEASFSHLTSSKGTSTLTTTLGDQTSSIATFHPEIPSVPATVGEETCSIPAPSAEETRSILPNLDAETPIHPVTLAEETPSISRTLGEDTPSVPAAFNEEAPVGTLIFTGGTHTLPGKLDRETKTVPTTLCEETTIPATLGQETPTLPATLGEETHSIPSILSDENRGIPTNLDEESPTDPVTLAEESPSIPETLGEETPSVPPTFSEETPAVPPSFSEGTTIPPSFNEETPTVPVTLGPETLTISTTTSEETAKIPATSGEETTSAPVTLHEETLAIPTTLDEGSPTMTTKLDEDTPTSPTNLAEETLTTPTSSGVEASTVHTTNSEETTAVSTTTEMETLPPAGAESNCCRGEHTSGSDIGVGFGRADSSCHKRKQAGGRWLIWLDLT
ncbi:Serine/threonine-protein kinase ATM [Gossypium australe]|uniref:Serine/threonine-protein kinase ATM n=1 Tax=Gossypium australe TaxID=47621 RepID=A0A5B6V4L9_9ROSI|nr:Serine/threonine-protein kinase ATM [Gossypium australe]